MSREKALLKNRLYKENRRRESRKRKMGSRSEDEMPSRVSEGKGNKMQKSIGEDEGDQICRLNIKRAKKDYKTQERPCVRDCFQTYKELYKAGETEKEQNVRVEELRSKRTTGSRQSGVRMRSKFLNEMREIAHLEMLNQVHSSPQELEKKRLSILSFCKNIEEGPYFICSCCQRMLYKRSVRLLYAEMYGQMDLFTGVRSVDNREYICRTCHKKVVKGDMPCQAVRNKMELDEIPDVLKTLRKLESVLVAQKIVFQQVVIMPKGNQPKPKGGICNIPISCEMVSESLPRPSEASGIIMLKLKRKLHYSGHQYYEAVRPSFVENSLNYLKRNNSLYSSVSINMKNIDRDLIDRDKHEMINSVVDNSNENEDIGNDSSKDDMQFRSADQEIQDIREDDAEEIDDPLNEYRVSVNETCLESWSAEYPIQFESDNVHVDEDQPCQITATGNEVFSTAPGEGRHPIHFMMDKHCEELAFPVLFPNGKFGYQVERPVKLSPSKYFNARLLHYSGRFAINHEYIFFAQFITEQKKVQDSISIALKKVPGVCLTARQVRELNTSTINHLIAADQAYYFMKTYQDLLHIGKIFYMMYWA